MTMYLGYSMMISAPPQRNLSAKKVSYAIFFIHISLVLCCVNAVFLTYSLSFLFTAKGQGPPPQPPTSGPG